MHLFTHAILQATKSWAGPENKATSGSKVQGCPTCCHQGRIEPPKAAGLCALVATKVFFSPSVHNGLMTTTTCSDHEAGVSFTSVNNDQETSVDYVCTSESGETVRKFQQAYLYNIMSLTAEWCTSLYLATDCTIGIEPSVSSTANSLQ